MADNSNGFTPLDLAMLAYPFRRADHDFLQGYVYIQEEAIAERLDTVDPNWSIRIDEAIAYGDSIVMRSTLTVKGVSRSNAGGNPVQRDKEKRNDKGYGTGEYDALPQYTQADNGVNAYKSSATDALKRCARMFGIGRYLLSAPKVSKDDTTKFDGWLAEEHKQAKARLDALRQIDTTTGEITPKGVEPLHTTQSAPERATGVQNGIPDPKPEPPSPSTVRMPNGKLEGGGLPDVHVDENGSVVIRQADGSWFVEDPLPAPVTAPDADGFKRYLVHEIIVTEAANGGRQYVAKSEIGDNIVVYGGDAFGAAGYDTSKWNATGKPNTIKPPCIVEAKFDGKKWTIKSVEEAL